eukprot:271206-Heterocapsa_arctica.AAC.1
MPWSASAASWLCSGSSSANWANKHTCRWCATKKTYADVAKLSSKKPPEAPSARTPAAMPPPPAAQPPAASPTTTTPPAASPTTTPTSIKLKISALQAAKLANEAAELPTDHI